MSSFLSKRLTGRGLSSLKGGRILLNLFPASQNLLNGQEKEDSFTGFLHGDAFAALHFDYVGPVKGHRLGNQSPL
jgi:hypothetical protein